MSQLEPTLLAETEDNIRQQIQVRLQRLEHRDWWLRFTTVLVSLVLTVAVVALSLRILLSDHDSFFQFNLNQAVRGLVGLVLLFNIYTIYQQILLSRLRRQLTQQQAWAQEIEKLAIFDPLTGLYNRRVAEQRLSEEIARSQRSKYPLNVLLLDLNDFKQTNDLHGHLAGDLVLKEFSRRLQKSIRFSDVPVRMGGDEFMVLLPECPTEQVELVLDRLSPLEVDFRGKKIPVTFAAGWAAHQPHESPEQLLEHADRALYTDKRSTKETTPI